MNSFGVIEERMDALPSREAMLTRDNKHRRRSRGRYYSLRSLFPWNAVKRFLLSRVGQKFDDVVSEFVRLDWVPPEFRSYSRLVENFVTVNTFLYKGRVYFYEKHGSYWRYNDKKLTPDIPLNARSLDNHIGSFFYVHPETGNLAYKFRVSLNYGAERKRREATTFMSLGEHHQLLRLKGTWTEIKVEPATPLFINDYKWTHYKAGQRLLSHDICENGLPEEHHSRQSFLLHLRLEGKTRGFRVVLFRQLNRKELKKFNLRNK